MNESKTPEPTAKELTDLGYSQGLYTMTCIDCKEVFLADKRAVRCRSCAVDRWKIVPDKSLTPTPDLCECGHWRHEHNKVGSCRADLSLSDWNIEICRCDKFKGPIDTIPPAAIKESLTAQTEGPGMGLKHRISDLQILNFISNLNDAMPHENIFTNDRVEEIILDLRDARAEIMALRVTGQEREAYHAGMENFKSALRPQFERLVFIIADAQAKGHTVDPKNIYEPFTREVERLALAPQAPASPSGSGSETCEWKEDSDGVWTTSCEQAWFFDSGDPRENNCKFCHSCGKPLVETKYKDPDDEPQPDQNGGAA